MEAIKKLNIKIKEIFGGKQSKTATFIILLGCAGMLLVFLSELVPENVAANETNGESIVFDISEKESELENRLEAIISEINGAGKTSVMLTMDSSKEYYYAKNSSENEDETEKNAEDEIVIIDGENGEEPIVLKTDEAKIRGVLVICEGGENAVVREKIIEALCALLDVPSNKISVAKMA